MPTYTLEDTETGEQHDVMMTWDDLQEYKKGNPHLRQVITGGPAIVGGVGNPVGAIAGGFVIAFSELFVTFAYKKVLTYLLPESLAPESLMQLLSTEYKIALSFVILVIVLLIRPTGLFSGKTL